MLIYKCNIIFPMPGYRNVNIEISDISISLLKELFFLTNLWMIYGINSERSFVKTLYSKMCDPIWYIRWKMYRFCFLFKFYFVILLNIFWLPPELTKGMSELLLDVTSEWQIQLGIPRTYIRYMSLCIPVTSCRLKFVWHN